MSSPLRTAALALSVAFGVIGMSVGINALHKSQDAKDFVKTHAPAGVSVDINTKDVFDSGVIVTVVCGLLALTSLLTLFSHALHRRRASTPRAAHNRASALLHAFLSVWLFAALVPFTDFARNRQAKVSASIGGTPLPPALVQQQQRALGVSPVYWDQHYIRLLAILPWFALLFGVIAAAVLFTAPSRAPASHTGPAVAEAGVPRKSEAATVDSTEKREVERDEKREIESTDKREVENRV